MSPVLRPVVPGCGTCLASWTVSLLTGTTLRRASPTTGEGSRRVPVTAVQLAVAHAVPCGHEQRPPREGRRPGATPPVDRRTPAGPGEGDPGRDPVAVRRAGGGGGTDRGHRPSRRDQPGDRLPALHRQGGAVRAGPGRLPRRA